nr:HAMP domain-containing sensor histidine kinase [Acinetobacter sp. Marseille-Q1620]
MGLNLLEISETEQLSACKIALLLDVFTPDNEIEGFLKLARSFLKTENAILAFDDEPYIWFNQFDKFNALNKGQQDASECIHHFFDGALVIDQKHHRYGDFSNCIHELGVPHNRAISFDLRKKNTSNSFGRVTFFDHNKEYYEQSGIDLAFEFIQQMVKFIALKFENAELKEKYEQQVATNTSKTRFFQIIAHDLRAPFHGLLGFSEVLAKERETLHDLDVQNISEYLHETAESTYNLLENLLNWAMAEEGQFVYHPIRFNLKQVTKIVCEILSPLAFKKNIQLIDDVPEHLMLLADINMITSVIQNLVSNALKFTATDGNGKVSIRAAQKGHKIEIYIQDSGLGMSSQQVQNIFKPNIKVSHKGTSGEKGTGLGLVLCKHFIDMNHGQIEVKSRSGVGTVFKLSLPDASTNFDYEI